MAGYIGTIPVPQATESRSVFTATSNQTTFATGGYTPNLVSVFLNGVHLARADFAATNGTDVVLAVGAAADDTVEIIAFNAFEASSSVFTADVGTSGTFLPEGDTAAGDDAAVGYTAAEGLILTGQGSTSDVTIKNDADATVMSIATGTTGATFAGDVIVPDGDFILGSTAVTSTAAELNILDGVTSTAAELNILDGVTATATELNLIDGVTATTAELNILDGVTSTAAELNILDVSNSTIGDLSEISTAANDDVIIALDTSGGGIKKITRSTFLAGSGSSSDIANVVEDTTPQLGGNLDMNGKDIVTTSNATLDLAPNGTGTVVVRGNTNSGAITYNCESNSHGQKIQAQPHSASATNTMLLPEGANSTLVSRVSVDTLTNKTLTTPVLTTPIANAGVQLKNGSTSAGFLEFFEDSDNGSNKVTLIGPASTADITLTLPATAGTVATEEAATTIAADEATALAIALG